ncbi:MAG TPA: glycosyltransferase, partial [Polyangiaceae bacterium]
MRVLYVNPGAELGGSERSLADLLASLRSSSSGLEMKLLVFADGELVERVRGLGIDVDVLSLPEGLATFGEYGQGKVTVASRVGALARGALAARPFVEAFRREVESFAPTLVHTNGMKAHFAAALATPLLPRVVHLRDFVSERPFTRNALPLLRRNALFVTNSRAVEDDALRLEPRLDTRVVYNGID